MVGDVDVRPLGDVQHPVGIEGVPYNTSTHVHVCLQNAIALFQR